MLFLVIHLGFKLQGTISSLLYLDIIPTRIPTLERGTRLLLQHKTYLVLPRLLSYYNTMTDATITKSQLPSFSVFKCVYP